MELTIDEQKLLADFRRLSVEGQRALLDAATRQARKRAEEDAESQTVNQCRLPEHEKRPEAADEPIFTE
jgi:hypothetical protein